jgi:hypothetical protein
MLRNLTRRIGNWRGIRDAAARVGFDVAVTTPERDTLQSQLVHARCADVMLSIHGNALTWMIMMEGDLPLGHPMRRRNASSCHHVVELRHFGRPFKRRMNPYELMASSCGLGYTSVKAEGVEFDPQYANRARALKKALLRNAIPPNEAFVFQTALYEESTVRASLEGVYVKVMRCLRSDGNTIGERVVGTNHLRRQFNHTRLNGE